MESHKNKFSPEDILLTKPAETVGLTATINREGLPHISLITSLQATGSASMTAGEFCRGKSKINMEENRKVGFLIMTLAKEFWTGTALWRRKETHGPEFEEYNSLPMFRYNSYFGINTVHYLDLVSLIPRKPLPMGAIVASALMTRAVAPFSGGTRQMPAVLNPFSISLINKLDSLIFLSFIGDDGFPRIIPVIQAVCRQKRRIVFHGSPFSEGLKDLKPGKPAALFCMNLKMETVLLRGQFTGYRRTLLGKTGVVEIDWVYNSMPPAHRQIYPEVPLEAVTLY